MNELALSVIGFFVGLAVGLLNHYLVISVLKHGRRYSSNAPDGKSPGGELFNRDELQKLQNKLTFRYLIRMALGFGTLLGVFVFLQSGWAVIFTAIGLVTVKNFLLVQRLWGARRGNLG